MPIDNFHKLSSLLDLFSFLCKLQSMKKTVTPAFIASPRLQSLFQAMQETAASLCDGNPPTPEVSDDNTQILIRSYAYDADYACILSAAPDRLSLGLRQNGKACSDEIVAVSGQSGLALVELLDVRQGPYAKQAFKGGDIEHMPSAQEKKQLAYLVKKAVASYMGLDSRPKIG